ncbi:MAG: RelA/SpoT family protein [Rikenellaceae bacterium]
MEIDAEDERLIEQAWLRLEQSCIERKICSGEDDWNLIRKAFFLAKEAHHGVRRRSGEPYFLHPIAVAQIIVDEMGMGVKSIVASLLHDVVEDTDYTVEDIERLFDHKIASMVDGLTKMSGVFNAERSEQAEYFRKVLLTLSDDVRVILIKIADRLHNMRTLGSMPLNKQIKITSETIYLFAPLAYRLGLFAIKSELEDLSMMYRHPEEYKAIKSKLEQTSKQREDYIERFNAPIIEMLDRNGVKYEVSGRVKSIYSIWTKMQRKQITFEEIYDLYAIRIVFEALPFPSETTQCWQIYGSITDIYKPNTDRLRDWISIPKDNGYEALHATVMGPDGVWVEVQLRTKRMDDIAEMGFAAHWKYKQSAVAQNDEIERWLEKIRDALNSPSENAVDFLDNFKLSLYTTEIVVFTPKGESRKLPQGATALDFAYEIHSKIGNRAIGAKINHQMKPIITQLKNGDQIEIITSESARPRPEWLKSVITSKAVSSIKAMFKSERDNNIERGMDLFEREMKRLEVPVSGRVMRKVLPAYESATKDEFYSKLGAGIIHLADLDAVLKSKPDRKILKFWTLFIPQKDDEGGEREDKKTKGKDESDSGEEFVIAECCNPIPGDEVVGFRNYVDNTIVVHKASCSDLHRLAARFGNQIIKDEIKWSHSKSVSYLCMVAVRGVDRMGFLMDILKVVTGDLKIDMREVNFNSHDGIVEGKLSLYVKDLESLSRVLNKIKSVKGVDKVARVDTN